MKNTVRIQHSIMFLFVINIEKNEKVIFINSLKNHVFIAELLSQHTQLLFVRSSGKCLR